jgi:hypothetical protein
MPQPAPIPFPAFRASSGGPAEPDSKKAAPAQTTPTLPGRAVKGVTRLPLTVPVRQPGVPTGTD